jgi:hypothetical protein
MVMKLMDLVMVVLSLALILEMLTKKEEFIRVQVDNHAGQ